MTADFRSRYSVRPLEIFLLTAVLWLLTPVGAFAQDVREKIVWGPHTVGFRSEITLDQGRRYQTTFEAGQSYGSDGKSPRPILINLWYPALSTDTVEPMPYSGYLRLSADQPDVQRWAGALSAYAADVITGEVFGVPVAELDERQQDAWKRFLQSETKCQRNAAPQEGPFPVVVYHSGAGSSFEDNSVFCEYLASCGYVVIGSAFPEADGSSFGIDAGDGSVADMEFLSRFVATLDFAQWDRVAYAGHSAGAQACLRAMTRPDCPADALILLDTTVDYYSVAVPNFKYITDLALANVDQIRRPMLVVAGPEAAFQMCDQLVKADRSYLTVPDLGHNEFIAQGILRLNVLGQLDDRALDESLRKELQGADAVEQYYLALCYATKAYLDAELLNQDEEFQRLASEYAETRLGEDQLALEHVDVGASDPLLYQSEIGVPPTPRQLYRLANEKTVAEVCALMERYRQQFPESPIYNSNMLMCSLLYDLLDQDRLDDAQQLHQYAKGIGVDGVSTLRFLAFMSRLGKRTERERHFLERALLVDPDDKEAQDQLERLNADR